MPQQIKAHILSSHICIDLFFLLPFLCLSLIKENKFTSFTFKAGDVLWCFVSRPFKGALNINQVVFGISHPYLGSYCSIRLIDKCIECMSVESQSKGRKRRRKKWLRMERKREVWGNQETADWCIRTKTCSTYDPILPPNLWLKGNFSIFQPRPYFTMF